ncbi:MAG TPA: bifunctional riboflavin kinase/FAD synthetase [Kofleriaceae bacterium]|jgi:riboflavin kinase/FMN adenylyltransferase
MEIVHGHRSAPAWPRGSVVAIGNFDGVHVGHRALAAMTRALAAKHGAVPIALTFDPHPSALLSPKGAPTALGSLARRAELLGGAGLEAVVIEPFTRELAAFAPDAFIDEIVHGSLHARAIVVGYDFTYGAHRAGTVAQLREHGARAGIEIAVVEPVEVGGEVASSTRVRAYLRDGDLGGATRLLGRAWDVDGVVVHGAARGRTIGTPTANVAPDSDLAIKGGIYAVTLTPQGGRPLPGVASLGTNPTFVTGGGLVLEVHVLDWSGDLYDRHVRVAFVERLRDEATFDSIDALIAQIERDKDQGRSIFAR